MTTKTELLVRIVGLGICTGLLFLGGNYVTTKSKDINACDPANNAKVKVKGIVSKVDESEVGGLFVTITDGTNGCEVFVAGSKRELGNLRKLGNRVSFDGIIHNGIVTNPKHLQENVYEVVDAKGNLGETHVVKIRIHDVIWNRETIGITVKGANIGFKAPRAMADTIRWHEVNTLVVDANDNVLSINE
jgi:hypothetical protein